MTETLKSVSIYTKDGCGYCRLAKNWLDEQDIPYHEFDANQPEIWSVLKLRFPEVRTVPQIYVGSYRVGGYTDLMAMVDKGLFYDIYTPNHSGTLRFDTLPEPALNSN